jgi:hypothetical protein
VRPGSWACFVVAIACQAAGCGSALGIEDLRPPTIRGTLHDITSDITPSSMLAFNRLTGERISTAVTDKDANFTFPVTAGLPLDGYLEVLSGAYAPTISQLLTPVIDHADTFQDVFTTTAAGLQLLADDADTTLDATQWMVVGVVVDGGGSTVTGARVEAKGSDGQPVARLCYTRQDTGRPCGQVSTLEDGRAWLFGIKQGDTVTITARDRDGNIYEGNARTFTGSGLVFAPVRQVL